jgi:hypothetical protein
VTLCLGRRGLEHDAGENMPPLDALNGSRVDLDVEWLSRNGGFDVARRGGPIEVRLGLTAKALRKGES